MIFGITGNKKNFSAVLLPEHRSEAPFGGVMLPGDERQGMFTPGRERNEQTTNSEWANFAN
jgi:hypothetical protein